MFYNRLEYLAYLAATLVKKEITYFKIFYPRSNGTKISLLKWEKSTHRQLCQRLFTGKANEILPDLIWIMADIFALYDNNFRSDYQYSLLRTFSTLTFGNKAVALYSLDTLYFIRLKAIALLLRHSIYATKALFACIIITRHVV